MICWNFFFCRNEAIWLFLNTGLFYNSGRKHCPLPSQGGHFLLSVFESKQWSQSVESKTQMHCGVLLRKCELCVVFWVISWLTKNTNNCIPITLADITFYGLYYVWMHVLWMSTKSHCYFVDGQPILCLWCPKDMQKVSFSIPKHNHSLNQCFSNSGACPSWGGHGVLPGGVRTPGNMSLFFLPYYNKV